MLSLAEHSAAGCAEEQTDDVTDHLEDRLNCFVHNLDVLNGE